MTRYIATTLIAILLLVVALRSRGPGTADPATPGTPRLPALEPAKVESVEVADGRLVTVMQRLAGSVSRATLLYDLAGEERTLDSTSCRRAIERGAEVEGNGYASEVKLAGKLPSGAKNLRLVLEDETGTREVRIDG